MNFLFDDSSRTNKNFFYSLSAFAGNQVRDVRAFLFIASIAIIYALTVSGECYLCYPFLLTAAFCQLPVTVYSFLTTIILLCQFKGRGFEANKTYFLQNMWSTSFVVLFHCKCLGCYLVSSYLSFVELLNAQRSSIIQNLKDEDIFEISSYKRTQKIKKSCIF